LFFSLFALKVVHVPLAAFAVLGGAVALGVGFGSQNIINNFISGLILHAERPVKVGDLIQLDDLYGIVEHIGARSTRVRTGSNLEIIVPNSTFLQNNVINFTLSSDKVRTFVEVGVVYGSPVVTVTQLLRRAVVETGRVSKDPPPIILFKDFGASALMFEIHFWIRMRTTMDRLQVESTVRFRIEELFNEEGITIAFPQQDLHLDTTSPLSVQMLPPPVDAAKNDP
jgi:small-conductance mechanosensitive channel